MSASTSGPPRALWYSRGVLSMPGCPARLWSRKCVRMSLPLPAAGTQILQPGLVRDQRKLFDHEYSGGSNHTCPASHVSFRAFACTLDTSRGVASLFTATWQGVGKRGHAPFAFLHLMSSSESFLPLGLRRSSLIGPEIRSRLMASAIHSGRPAYIQPRGYYPLVYLSGSLRWCYLLLDQDPAEGCVNRFYLYRFVTYNRLPPG